MSRLSFTLTAVAILLGVNSSAFSGAHSEQGQSASRTSMAERSTDLTAPDVTYVRPRAETKQLETGDPDGALALLGSRTPWLCDSERKVTNLHELAALAVRTDAKLRIKFIQYNSMAAENAFNSALSKNSIADLGAVALKYRFTPAGDKSVITTAYLLVKRDEPVAAALFLKGYLKDHSASLCKATERVVRDTAAETLEKIGETSIPALVAAPGSKKMAMREQATLILGRIGKQAPTVIPALINLLADKDSPVRHLAASALGKFGEEAQSAVPRLITRYPLHMKEEFALICNGYLFYFKS